jgi:hypothetical protein
MHQLWGDGRWAQEFACRVLPAGQRQEPVREWLKELSTADHKIVGDDIRDLDLARKRLKEATG